MVHASFADVLVTSVPAHDLARAQRALPGARIEEARLSSELAAKHPDARVLCVMIHDPVTPDILARFPSLAAVVTRSAGFDHLPAAYLSERGIPGLNLGGYATTSVAHLALTFILALLRRVPEGHATTHAETRWERAHLVGRHLADVTVGVLGVGRIGSEVVRLVNALGGSCVGHDLEHRPEMVRAGFRYVESYEALLRESDVVTLHVPLAPLTRGMVDADALARMRTGALLVNTARGEIVDQVAVERALREGQLAGYAADVLPDEPRAPDLARFRDLPNVLLTPHLGAYDRRALDARYEYTARAVRAVLEKDGAVLAEHRVI